MKPSDVFGTWGEWNDRLHCHLRGVILPDSDHVIIYLAPGNCTDMRGAVELAKHILPRVARITTWAGDEEDTYYTQHPDGGWKSHCLRRVTTAKNRLTGGMVVQPSGDPDR